VKRAEDGHHLGRSATVHQVCRAGNHAGEPDCGALHSDHALAAQNAAAAVPDKSFFAVLHGRGRKQRGQFTGLQYSTIGNTTLIAFTMPAVTALLAVFFLCERLLPVQWLGIAISLLGVLILFSKGSLEALLHISFSYSDILFFCAQLGWAAYMLIGFRVMWYLSALTTTAWAGVFGALTTFVHGLLTGELHYAPLSTAGMAYMAYVVWVGGVCATWSAGISASRRWAPGRPSSF